ncbi:bifunctional glutamate N-acetyltransferase/amino-acid acetyltransferase ArgJ [Streptomyces sp. RFCAC02]|uniref:bifunctional glutamate N-acetyltransferase/amino-acid acetyltransferase ArgJ n=1 Tax=Streptomyces sp. RFCAC02 TaxID=2499143 RepID=UPI0010217535|nr:bifunctional glutamate N-acetyltransferase/amino-acid acetyltransferase ArgJ [Streptomyces sp. RFCAC02]
MTVTAARGFRAAGVAAGLAEGGVPDLALVVNDGPGSAAAGVFTANRVQAAPVLWSRQVLAGGRVTAVVLNSGGANACTGPLGFQDTHAAAEHAAAVLGHNAAETAVASAGPLGVRLPMDRLLPGIDQAAAALSPHGGDRAALAIRTTDAVPKTAVAERDGWTVGGMAKGAGALAPALATLVVVLTTDADIDPPALDRALRAATRATFDRVDAAGFVSTNDTVLLLASGASGTIPDEDTFAEAVLAVCADLARQIVQDADGAGKHLRVEVTGAASEDDAVEAARAIARSGGVKSAAHREETGGGCVLAAIGTASAAFEPHRLAVAVNGVPVCRDGQVVPGHPPVDLRFREVRITADLAAGDASATVLTNDLTADHAQENGAHRS